MFKSSVEYRVYKHNLAVFWITRFTPLNNLWINLELPESPWKPFQAHWNPSWSCFEIYESLYLNCLKPSKVRWGLLWKLLKPSWNPLKCLETLWNPPEATLNHKLMMWLDVIVVMLNYGMEISFDFENYVSVNKNVKYFYPIGLRSFHFS